MEARFDLPRQLPVAVDQTKLRLSAGFPRPGANHKLSQAAVSANEQPFVETPLLPGQTTTSGFGAYAAAMEGRTNADLRGNLGGVTHIPDGSRGQNW